MLPLLASSDTTENLITNGTFDNGTTGWTLSGDAQVVGDCCPGGHDLEFGDLGSIDQDFNLLSDTITQPMLNNGITLDSSVEVQNGEGGVGSWAPNRGSADTFSIRLQIKDENQNVLATTIQERTNVTGINGKTFTDSISYTGTGANIGNLFISGSDAAAPANLGGPNVDNISVTMTYDPTVLTVEQTQEIAAIFEEIEEVFMQEELIFEEVFVEPIIEEVYVESIPEIIEMTVEEEFIEETIVLAPEVIEEEIILVEPEVQVEEEVLIAEEIYEEVEAPMEEASTETEEVTEPTETVEETTVADSGSTDDVTITVDDIAIKVADKIKTIDGQLKATQMIVAKVMQNRSKISSYAQVNAEIFVQPEIKDINIDSYIASSYVDIRQIYSNQTYEDRLWTSRQ